MQLSPNFSLREFTYSTTAIRHGISNDPSPEHLSNLKVLAAHLELVRELLGHPMTITSGYRSPELNRLVDGSSTSSHSHGLAADFHCYGYGSDFDVCRRIAASRLKFDQLIYEQANSTWVHLGFDSKMRRDIISWRKGLGYRNGIVKF